MSLAYSIRKHWPEFLAPLDSELDPGFREEIYRLNRLGMQLAMGLAIVAPLLSMTVSILVLGEEAAFSYLHPPGAHPIYFESMIILLGILGFLLTYSKLCVKFGRMWMSLLIILISLNELIETVANHYPEKAGDIPAYVPILLFIGVGTMPYRAWQTIALGASLFLVTYYGAIYAPPYFGMEPSKLSPYTINFFVVLTFISAGISALKYRIHYTTYLARSREAKLHKQIEDSEYKYRGLFENSADGIFVIDNTTNKFVQVNPAIVKLFGIPEKEIYETEFSDIIDERDRDMIVKRRRARLQGKNEPSRYLIRIKTRLSSEPMICDLTVHGVDADVTRGSIRDVTKLVKSQEKTREYAKALEKTNRELKDAQSQVVQSAKMAALGDLVAGVAHEINTPLGSIHSNADLSQRAVEIVEQSLNDEEFSAIKTKYPRLEKALKALREATATSLTASDRIVEIVKSLRNFARLDESDRKVADLHEGIESTLTLLRHKLKTGIKVEKNYGDLPELDCFPNRLNQVFMNILVNAIHSMDGKGVITITTRREEENVTLEFRDTGRGIPPSNIGRIFDPGFTTKGAGVGSGLGLSISYRIIQEHDGNIEVKSEPGEGTTFTITLPIRN